MEQILYLTGLGIAAFVSTNIDDFFITTTFFMESRYSVREIILGKYLGLIFLIAVSCMGYLFKLVIPVEWIGLMGILPIIIGARHLYMSRKEKRGLEIVKAHEAIAGGSFQGGKAEPVQGNMDAKVNLARSGIMLVTLITFANGGDNIGVYMPLFASLSLYELILLVMMFLLMLAALLSAAYYFTSITYISGFLRKYGEPGFP